MFVVWYPWCYPFLNKSCFSCPYKNVEIDQHFFGERVSSKLLDIKVIYTKDQAFGYQFFLLHFFLGVHQLIDLLAQPFLLFPSLRLELLFPPYVCPPCVSLSSRCIITIIILIQSSGSSFLGGGASWSLNFHFSLVSSNIQSWCFYLRAFACISLVLCGSIFTQYER
jgi:hypothetical protein